MLQRLLRMVLMKGIGRAFGGKAARNARHANRAVRMAQRMRR